MCYELTKWPTSFHQWDVHGDNSSISSPVIDIYINIDLSSWQSDGNFMEVPTTYICKTAIGAKELPTTSLSIVPFACLAAEKRASLLRRGEMFWKCRKIHYVSYGGWDFEGLEHFENSRFVVDPSLSKACYRHNPTRPTEQNPELIDHLGAEAMKRAEPPGVNFLLTTPTFIWGFNMQDKLWKKLSVANVNNIDWDEKAFDNLVIDPDSKDPLYRVTCGDIGTKPEAVEQYLKKVLTLGKSWDCVVLLDEAEVFLQERSLEDIERNALVSVFLRNLEYYDGILILTSNRVATFDEGFRSRIQLAIHYPKLEQAERRRVWENFVNRLNDDPIASAEVDIRNLRSNLTELSKFNLNGREIRNAISVARPLVKSEERKVDFESLKKVIRVQQKFDAYMKDVNEGLDDEKVAREEGKR
ncbi:hypothetical protein F4801DRAFT_550498 [Xylaria longipes]|nr:hypothetical protein F4801DRAFT_550498 [Xylaria longipes]